jgi:hypothetical protein
MLMVGRVPLALLATRAAGRRAGLDDCADDAEIERGLAGHDAAGGLAGVGAVEAEPNAPDQLLQVFLAETGVAAAGTGNGTVETVLDTAQERVAIKAVRLRMRLDQFSNCHFVSFRSRKSGLMCCSKPIGSSVADKVISSLGDCHRRLSRSYRGGDLARSCRGEAT